MGIGIIWHLEGTIWCDAFIEGWRVEPGHRYVCLGIIIQGITWFSRFSLSLVLSSTHKAENHVGGRYESQLELEMHVSLQRELWWWCLTGWIDRWVGGELSVYHPRLDNCKWIYSYVLKVAPIPIGLLCLNVSVIVLLLGMIVKVCKCISSMGLWVCVCVGARGKKKPLSQYDYTVDSNPMRLCVK